ncbi:MAG: enoyl-CoA hydratase-related protein, partial [Tomitella sp.]|nr:enoyl-CoA hydratase-related protein [Tomitella sp.]
MPETTAEDGATAPFVRYEATGGHAVLTLDSPHNRNAISPRLIADFADGLDRARQDPQVRAIVLTHTGGSFCAGADLSAAAGGGG